MAILKTHTLGCKVNQYETELVREGLRRIGFRDPQSAEERADLCLINTCTVTSEGDAKSRQVIRRLHRQNPDAQIVVMGCYATRAPQELAALPGVTDVITDKRELPDWLARAGVIDVPHGISRFQGRHRAYVKVQDGCYLRCSYCIIPLVRPDPVSREVGEIETEVERLVSAGHREIVLTGIHLGHYGVDRNRGKPKRDWVRLSHLVRRLARLPGSFRLRLSSIEATEVTHELLDAMVEHAERVCPHLHVCLQSGSDAVLRRMRRRWSVRMFMDRCELIRRRLPEVALTTDLMVGFPGETEADFEATCRVARAVGFSKIHVFPFSRRRGTPAAEMPDQVPPQVRADRAARLGRIERALRHAYWQSQVGRSVEVLVERQWESSDWGGTSRQYVPVRFRGRELVEPGELARLRVTGCDERGLRATMV